MQVIHEIGSCNEANTSLSVDIGISMVCEPPLPTIHHH